jgi:hypothetical protein
MLPRVAVSRARRPHQVDARSQQELIHELAKLPPARRGPALRPGTRIVRPSLTRRQPQPMIPRLLDGEFQRRLVLVLTGVTIFAVVIVALGGSFFV